MSELNTAPQEAWVGDVRIPAGEATLDGDLQISLGTPTCAGHALVTQSVLDSRQA